MSYTIWQDHLAHGAQVRIEAYPDRLRVTNPGGLHGEISRTRLFIEPLTSSRNSHLARLLEDVEIPRTNRTMCENRGSGLLAVARELRKAGLEPPDLADRISATTITIRTAGYDAQPPRQPHLTGATTEPGRPIRVRATDSMAPSLSAGAATEPRARIRELLADGPLPTRTLAEALGMTPQGALRQLRKMEETGEVELTEPARRSPLDRWRLANPPDTH